jgi:hypothetical protein
VVNRVRELVTGEKVGVQFFSNRGIKEIVYTIMKFTSREVGVAKVYNHLRHFCRLKKMEGMR